MKILILASYTTKQKDRPDNCIRREDLEPASHFEHRIKELSGYGLPAGEMFTGQLHTKLREGLRQIRAHKQYGKTTLDLYFPWYHFRVDRKETPVNENDIIVPFDIAPRYDVEILEFGKSGIPESIVALIDRYDLVFLLLRPADIRLLQRVFEVERAATLIFLIARSNAKYVADYGPNVHAVYTADLVGQIDGVSNYNHQGAVFRKLCEAAYHQGIHIFEQVKQDPQRLLEIVLK